jgi:chromosome partitioning protein
VSTPQDDTARARAIFERLRAAGNAPSSPTPAPPEEQAVAPTDRAAGARPASEDDIAGPLGDPFGPEHPVDWADEEEVDAGPDDIAGPEGDPFAPPGAPAVDPSALYGRSAPDFTADPPVPDGPAASEAVEPPAAVASAEVVPGGAAPQKVRPPLPRVLAIANQKGGVGKTTTAVNLGAALAELGYRVLVIDLDPQGNATTGLGVNSRNLEASVYDVIMHDLPLEDCVEPTSVRNLFVAPATIDLAGAEIELVPAFSRELKLRRAIEAAADDFDYTLIDCPPSLGLLTVNGLAAAREVVVPIQCEYYALEGLGQLLRNVALVQGNLNPDLTVSTIILTMYDARTKLAEQVAGEVRKHFGDKVCRNIVPRTVRLSEAPSFGQPIIVFDSSSRGAIAYRELAKEVSGGAPQRIG